MAYLTLLYSCKLLVSNRIYFLVKSLDCVCCRMVVKFTDAVKRAELAIKLKKKKDKLRARLKELEELNGKEKELLCSCKYLLHTNVSSDISFFRHLT